MKIYNAKILYGKEFEVIEGFIEIKKGKINKIKEVDAIGDFDAEGAIVMPSFINAHVHLLDALGKNLWYGKSLDELVRPPNSLKHKLLKEPRAKIKSSAKAAIKETIASGVTYYCEFSNLPEVSKELMLESGILGKILYEPVNVMNNEAVHENILDDNVVKEALEKSSECDGLGISGVCEFSDNTLKKLATKSNYFASHVAEHKISQSRSLRLSSKTEVERTISLKPKFIVHLTNPIKKDLKLVTSKKIPVICCPRANATLNVGTPPIAQLLKNKILVALGTDNVMFNSPNILKELGVVAKLCPKLEPKAILKLATLNPAKIFKLNKGIIEEGRDADFIILKIRKNLQYSRDILASIIHSADQRNIQKVYFRGKEAYSR